MRRKAPYDLEKVTLNLRKGDADFIAQHHPQHGYQVAIRLLIASYVDKVQRMVEEKVPKIEGLDLEIAPEVKETAT